MSRFEFTPKMKSINEVVEEHMSDIDLPAVLKNVPSEHHYAWQWAYLDLVGKQLFGMKFKLHPADVNVILPLMAWYNRDENIAAKCNIRLEAGLLITGPVGCGKTSLAKLCAYTPYASCRPIFKSCMEISYEVESDGPATILHYTRHSFDAVHQDHPRIYAFDDLGTENVVNYYGNHMMPMVDILAGRYDYFLSHGMQTIITTNLTSHDIENRYGTRIRSRLREMMNLVSFSAKAVDKR